VATTSDCLPTVISRLNGDRVDNQVEQPDVVGAHAGAGAIARPSVCTIFGKALALVTGRVDPRNVEWRPEP
jgi:hypothetical protein